MLNEPPTTPTSVLLLASTTGWSGACGFLKCDVTKNADTTVPARVSAVAPTFSKSVRTSDGDRGLQEWNPLERRAEDLPRVGAEVAAQDLLIHRPKVDGVLEVAGVVQARQARLFSEETAVHRVADQKQGRGRAVVGASPGALLRAPAALRPRRGQHLVRHVVGGKVLVESRHRRVKVPHQVVVAAELPVVAVESPAGVVGQLHAGPGDDELGRELQRRRKLVLRRVNELDLIAVADERLGGR